MVIWPCGEAVTLLSVRHFTTMMLRTWTPGDTSRLSLFPY